MLWEDQGEYQHLTFWEQMDAGIPWTNKKKVLLIVPVVLYVIVRGGDVLNPVTAGASLQVHHHHPRVGLCHITPDSEHACDGGAGDRQVARAAQNPHFRH